VKERSWGRQNKKNEHPRGRPANAVEGARPPLGPPDTGLALSSLFTHTHTHTHTVMHAPPSTSGRPGAAPCSQPEPGVVLVRADAAPGALAAAAPFPPASSPVDRATAAAIHAVYAADLAEAEGGGGGGGVAAAAADDAAIAAALGAVGALTNPTPAPPAPGGGGGGDDLFDLLDPTPDVHGLFAHYNAFYFGGCLGAVSVEWAPRMTLCAGTCAFTRAGGARIRLSAPLLSLRPSADLKNTLLHEMVHAAIFLSGQRDTGDHGALFMAHAARINGGGRGGGASSSGSARFGGALHVDDPVRPPGGYRIEAYHSFHAEVEAFRVHHWRCGGPCGTLVKRASNRPPQPADCVRAGRRRGGGPCDGRGCWWHGHEGACGGAWVKVAGPEPKQKRGGRARGRVVAGEPDLFLRGSGGRGRKRRGAGADAVTPSVGPQGRHRHGRRGGHLRRRQRRG